MRSISMCAASAFTAIELATNPAVNSPITNNKHTFESFIYVVNPWEVEITLLCQKSYVKNFSYRSYFQSSLTSIILHFCHLCTLTIWHFILFYFSHKSCSQRKSEPVSLWILETFGLGDLAGDFKKSQTFIDSFLKGLPIFRVCC